MTVTDARSLAVYDDPPEPREPVLIGEVVDYTAGLVLADEEPYVTITPTSLTFRDDTPYDIWLQMASRLNEAGKRINWYIADTLNFGERRYGEMYTQALADTGLAYKTLRNITWIGRQIDASRRRDDVGFYEQAEVAKLPPRVANVLLDAAIEQNWTQKQLRDQAASVRVELNRVMYAELPAPTLPIPDALVLVGSANRLPLVADSVHLIVTSPPYALRKDYTQGDEAAASWPRFMRAWLGEAYRVTAPSGRLCLNVPLDVTTVIDDEADVPRPGKHEPYVGNRPTAAQAIIAAQDAGWIYRNTILWVDDQLGKSQARGSVRSASAPNIYAPAEAILIFSKGPWHRDVPKGREGDIAHADWIDWLPHGIWNIPGEGDPWEGHPAPFPRELPHRLITIFSFPGDTVLDPFMGSGTTLDAGLRAGRFVVGVDVSPVYAAATRRRLAKWRTT